MVVEVVEHTGEAQPTSPNQVVSDVFVGWGAAKRGEAGRSGAKRGKAGHGAARPGGRGGAKQARNNAGQCGPWLMRWE